MDSQRIEIFHVTYRDAVVVLVTHHLIFYLFPSLDGFLHKDLTGIRKGIVCQLVEFLFIGAESGT